MTANPATLLYAARKGARDAAEREAQESVGHGFVIRGCDDIFAPLPEPDDLVESVVRRGSLVLLGAYGSSGKTWIAADLMHAVGLGQRWMGRFSCKAGDALLLDYESGDYELKRRLQALARARGVWLEDRPRIGFSSFPGAYMTEDNFASRIELLAKDHDLILFDSLAAMNPGVDENLTAMRLGLDKLKAIGERTQCTFVVILHAKKTSGNHEDIDEREIFRGSSAIYDAADIAFAVMLKKGALVVKQTKARHGRAAEPFVIRIEDAAGGVAVLTTDAPTPAGAVTQPEKFKAICEEVLRTIRDNAGCSDSFVRGNVTGGNPLIKAALEELEKRKAIRVMKGGKGKPTAIFAEAKR